jgi:hypothetical protein
MMCVGEKPRSVLLLTIAGLLLLSSAGGCTRGGVPLIDVRSVPRITVSEAKARLDHGENVLFLDSRSPNTWAAAKTKLPGAIRVPPGEVQQHLTEIPHGRPIVAYCL